MKGMGPMHEFVAQYWLQWIFGIVTAVLAGAYSNLAKRLKTQKKENKMIKDGLLALLHDRLYQCCSQYLSEGSVDMDALKNLEYLYTNYHELGGNGTGTELYNRVKSLPIRQ